MDKKVKPPLGIKPRDIWIEERYNDLYRAISEYYEFGFIDRIDVKWFREFFELSKMLIIEERDSLRVELGKKDKMDRLAEENHRVSEIMIKQKHKKEFEKMCLESGV